MSATLAFVFWQRAHRITKRSQQVLYFQSMKLKRCDRSAHPEGNTEPWVASVKQIEHLSFAKMQRVSRPQEKRKREIVEIVVHGRPEARHDKGGRRHVMQQSLQRRHMVTDGRAHRVHRKQTRYPRTGRFSRGEEQCSVPRHTRPTQSRTLHASSVSMVAVVWFVERREPSPRPRAQPQGRENMRRWKLARKYHRQS